VQERPVQYFRWRRLRWNRRPCLKALLESRCCCRRRLLLASRRRRCSEGLTSLKPRNFCLSTKGRGGADKNHVTISGWAEAALSLTTKNHHIPCFAPLFIYKLDPANCSEDVTGNLNIGGKLIKSDCTIRTNSMYIAKLDVLMRVKMPRSFMVTWTFFVVHWWADKRLVGSCVSREDKKKKNVSPTCFWVLELLWDTNEDRQRVMGRPVFK